MEYNIGDVVEIIKEDDYIRERYGKKVVKIIGVGRNGMGDKLYKTSFNDLVGLVDRNITKTTEIKFGTQLPAFGRTPAEFE